MPLASIPKPRFEPEPVVAPPSADELERRLTLARHTMESRGLTHLVVYGDPEHFANLWWLCHFDPRFEESILILRPDGPPLILIGNECEAYLKISPLLETGGLRSERFEDFSLMNQQRGSSRDLGDILRSEGIDTSSRVGCVGWKSYSDPRWMDVPAYIVDVLRGLAGNDRVECATDLFIHPHSGLRARCGAWEIAYFERSNWLASEALKRVMRAIRLGKTDRELLEEARYDGEPLSCHMTCKTGSKRISLASASGNRVELGNPWSANIGYWGSNICRAGWVAEREDDLPESARGYVERFAEPYFRAMVAWLGMMRIGMSGGIIHARMMELLPFGDFGVWLNPGHLIHGDEWLSSPIYPGSDIRLASGMVMQSDVIPSSARYYSARMEDGYAIACDALRAEIQDSFPDCWKRCQARRAFMFNELGIELPEELLPLSNLAGVMAPFVLRPELVFAAR